MRDAYAFTCRASFSQLRTAFSHLVRVSDQHACHHPPKLPHPIIQNSQSRESLHLRSHGRIVLTLAITGFRSIEMLVLCRHFRPVAATRVYAS